MNPFKFVRRRPLTALMLVVALVGGGVFGLYKMRLNIPGLNTPKLYASLDVVSVNANHMKGRLVAQYDAYFHKHPTGEVHQEQHKILVTSPLSKNVITTQDYVCQIHSQRHIKIQAFDGGYLEAIPVKEGQLVHKDELMFQIKPILFKTKLDAEEAERNLAKLEAEYTKKLVEQRVVAPTELALKLAKLAQAEAKVAQAKAEFDFATLKAPFEGIVDRLLEQQGSLIKEGDILTYLSDNSVMWVYFNVPEARYLEYMAEVGQNRESPDIELRLANLNKFPHMGHIDPTHNVGAIEGKFDPETGNIAFRADFPNPDRLLRNGQTGTVIISRELKNAILIPQRATYEILAKRYVYIVDEKDVVHQREIAIKAPLDDIFVIEHGVEVTDKIVFEGVRQVHDGEKIEFEFRDPAKVMANQKNHAE